MRWSNMNNGIVAENGAGMLFFRTRHLSQIHLTLAEEKRYPASGGPTSLEAAARFCLGNRPVACLKGTDFKSDQSSLLMGRYEQYFTLSHVGMIIQ